MIEVEGFREIRHVLATPRGYLFTLNILSNGREPFLDQTVFVSCGQHVQ